ncbi:hypothetical protein KUV51_18860 [Tateyamaria omphalii]|uniref:ABC transporter transmembrane domain-containing protein n=1 Tax=Tateyamaria omphalii TaxID=299262 RepID=UPI001C99C49D|nr:ABC transporter transmembrane domain-containing protein [Tateyamaria omphalii]MBY5935073.1 hypothetical protein [Tateyamaria omphalii]
MRPLPSLATRDRVTDAVLVVSCGIAQAAALAVAAFATRDAFAALHAGHVLQVVTIVELTLSAVVAALCQLQSRCRGEALGQSYAIALRRALYAQIARLPKARHDARRVGALSLRFVGDLSAARMWFGRGLPDVLTAAVVLPGAVFILFSLDPILAGFGLMPLGLALGVMAGTAWHLERRHRQLRRRRANIAISMIERIAIAPELDLMGRTEKELRGLDEQGAALKVDAVARRGRTVGLQSILQMGVGLSGLAILWLASRSGIAPAVVAASLSVLALVALPLRDLGVAWDHYCAWRVAREKARNLLAEPTVRRQSAQHSVPIGVRLIGRIEDNPVDFSTVGGTIARLEHENAAQLARIVAGLDHVEGVDLQFDGQIQTPRVSFIGDDHVGLQGSLRRSATLSAVKRPKGATIRKTLRAFGLGALLASPRGLDQRIAENGRGLTAAQTLRLDLARAALGKADIVVISSLRWQADADQDALLTTLRRFVPATVILAQSSLPCGAAEKQKVI